MQVFELTIASQLAQAAASLLLAGFIWLILLSRRRRYLLQLALSFVALAGFLAFGAVALGLSQMGNPRGFARLLFSLLSLSCLFPHLIWLWLGFRGAVRHPVLPRRLQSGLISLGAAAGALLALAAAYAAAQGFWLMAGSLRITIPYACAGIVYLGLAAALYRVREIGNRGQISPLITVSAFAAFGLHWLLAASLATWMLARQTLVPLSQFTGLLGLILLVAIALSFVIWLLETEQRRAAEAREQARSAEKRLLYFRTHDPATGLPNRRQMYELLGRELLQLRDNPGQRIGILSLGLHRYKLMSESMGWQRTEDMMRALTLRIRDQLPERFLLGRTGERDFLILMPRVGQARQAQAHAERILDRLRQPFKEGGRELFLKCSGGVSLAPDHAGAAADLIRLAERAQLQAAGLGEPLLSHRSADGEDHRDMLQIEAELRAAQRNGEFKLHYQPLISIRRRCITGFEALLRWEHPQRGLLNPAYFLDDASSLGVLDDLEDQIFDQAISQLAHWNHDLTLGQINVAINVSAQRFIQPDLAQSLLERCQRYGVSPSLVTVEITESSAIGDFEAGLDSIARLRQHGMKVSLDDFGTGYSALAHLQRLNVDYVKLDRSFIVGIDQDQRQLALTKAVVELIHSMGIEVLAEGVETSTQLGHMIQCRVDYVQGFLLGRARPPEDHQQALERREITEF
ncbi:MAG: putative bifunctional diguanylate cyclase/phosphodiesterase [Wenzhouxiangella sp.]